MEGNYRIILWTTGVFEGHYTEQYIYGYKTEAEAWEEFDERREAMEKATGLSCDGSVYTVAKEDAKRLGI